MMLTRKKKNTLMVDKIEEWLAVRFSMDNILFKCPNKYKNVKVGKFCEVEWNDGFSYRAKVLMKGREEVIDSYLTKVGKKFAVYSCTKQQQIIECTEKDLTRKRQILKTTVISQTFKDNDENNAISKAIDESIDKEVSVGYINELNGKLDISSINPNSIDIHDICLENEMIVDTAVVSQTLKDNDENNAISKTVDESIDKEVSVGYINELNGKLDISSINPNSIDIHDICLENEMIVDTAVTHTTVLERESCTKEMIYNTILKEQASESDIVPKEVVLISEEANFKINKYFDQKNVTSSVIICPDSRPHSNIEHGKDSSSLSDDSYEEDSGSEYLPYGDKLSFTSSLLRELSSNTSEKSEIPELPSTSNNFVAKDNEPLVPFVSKNFQFVGTVEKSKKNNVTNKRVWDKLDHCLYCEKEVTNFTRHLLRKHKNELDVVKYDALPKGSVERKLQADILRKRGNFLFNVGGDTKVKPVRRPYEFETKSTSVTHYLPCKHCLGMFKKQYLHRHFKICKCNKSIGTNIKIRNRPQVDGQNLLLAYMDVDEQLVTKVFPRMACDEISFVAKSDKLITAFGSRYLKCHKEKHLIAVVSQKMRTLARFLIAMRQEVNSIHSLMDCLAPQYFDAIVKCSKKIAHYNETTDSFDSPSLVLKIGQSLKQCCEIAEFIILKESDGSLSHANEKEKTNNLKYMIEKQWSYELSTNASKEIYQKKWNKPALIPLTSDIKMFRDYIVSVEKESHDKLKLNPKDSQAYRKLQESILAQIVLLNRRRSGEVQRIFVSTFNNSLSETSQEEITNALSPVELELTKSFKRIVIRGKRGKGVPILFTPHLQKLLNYLQKIRQTVDYISEKNPYLFPLVYTEDSCMRVSDIIRKFSKECGAKHPENITPTRLRKHVATVTQILNLSEEDIEQLATFMGHTKDVHKEFYRLSDSAFQVAKISKLLLMMEKGEGSQYRGKTLDEINISINDLISDVESESGDEYDVPTINQTTTDNKPVSPSVYPSSNKKQKSTPYPSPNCVSITNKIPKTDLNKTIKTVVPWMEEEKSFTLKFFKKHILLGKAPNKKECDELLRLHPSIKKPWRKIKDLVYNTIKKNNKNKFE